MFGSPGFSTSNYQPQSQYTNAFQSPSQSVSTVRNRETGWTSTMDANSSMMNPPPLSPIGHVQGPSMQSARMMPTSTEMMMIQNVLSKNWSVADKICELETILGQLRLSSADLSGMSPSVPKDLDSMFLAIVSHIFGSHAAQPTNLGPGWNLTGVTKSKHFREFRAIFSFLNASGVIMDLIKVLSRDPNCKFNFPMAKLPLKANKPSEFNNQTQVLNSNLMMQSFSTPNSQVPTSSTFQTIPTSLSQSMPGTAPGQGMNNPSFILLSPYEFYLYHFFSLLNYSSEWNHTDVIEGDCIYPVLLEDYLSFAFPLGGGNFQFLCNEMNPTLHPNAESLMAHKSSYMVFSTPISNGNMNSRTFGSPTSSQMSPEMLQSQLLLNTATKFWISCWMEERLYKSQYVPARLPSGDIVKMIRMIVKHIHSFINSFHTTSPSARDSILNRFFSDFFEQLYRLLEMLFDNWPMDASFRMPLETWLSYIQPWRYKVSPNNGNLPSNPESDAVAFEPGPWDRFIQENIVFYEVLLPKTLLRFVRMDLANNKNAFMLFRVTKVFSQDGLIDVLKRFDSGSGHSFKQMTFSRPPQSVFDRTPHPDTAYLSDEQFRGALSQLVIKALEAKKQVEDREKIVLRKNKDENDSFFGKIISFVFMHSSSALKNELDEIKKTLNYLDNATNKLCQIFKLAIDLETINSTGTEVQRPKFENTTPPKSLEGMTGQSRLITRFDDTSNEALLRSDEFHALARILYQVSRYINNTFDIKAKYYQRGLLGGFLRHICEPEMVVATQAANSNELQRVTLPPRIALRKLARHKVMLYVVLFIILCFLVGKPAIIKFLILCLFMWSGSIAYSAFYGIADQPTSSFDDIDMSM